MNYTYRLIERMVFPVDVTEQLEQKDADRMTERGSQRELIARLKLIKKNKEREGDLQWNACRGREAWCADCFWEGGRTKINGNSKISQPDNLKKWEEEIFCMFLYKYYFVKLKSCENTKMLKRQNNFMAAKNKFALQPDGNVVAVWAARTSLRVPSPLHSSAMCCRRRAGTENWLNASRVCPATWWRWEISNFDSLNELSCSSTHVHTIWRYF